MLRLRLPTNHIATKKYLFLHILGEARLHPLQFFSAFSVPLRLDFASCDELENDKYYSQHIENTQHRHGDISTAWRCFDTAR